MELTDFGKKKSAHNEPRTNCVGPLGSSTKAATILTQTEPVVVMPPEIFTAKDLAKYLQIGLKKASKLMNEELGTFVIGNTRRVSKVAVDRWIEEQAWKTRC